ncbi:MAG: Ig-like domain-containing protein [Ardenticatenales bacterium]|nr:Ig-like domain-containing protein [Ardenticatenales bacterium]
MTPRDHRGRLVHVVALFALLFPMFAALLPPRLAFADHTPTPTQVTAAGSFQSELGCSSDWDAACAQSSLQDSDSDGIYTFETTAIPAGNHEAKVTINGSWDEHYGAGGETPGNNIPFSVPAAGTLVTFSYTHATHVLTITVEDTGAGHDNNIFWDDLGHDSRDALYRTPGGAVEANTPVTLRLRAASGDLTAAQLRLWNDLNDAQQLLNMTLVADDGSYEWWEATVPASAEPTIYWYRFIAIDGTATAYYEDDAGRTGGWGMVSAESADRSWQLTVYDPTFTTPDWVKNGIMYQIFIDRFRDQVVGNNTSSGSFFYDTPEGTITRSNQANWNEPVCDPRDNSSACPGKYSENFYGGDLQGIISKLDYLSDLGVTVLYLNPIFESPSNHKYDTTDYSKVDDSFGGTVVFQELAAAAHARGMKIVLDGVFNHTSSDSIYFDRYQRFSQNGACESTDSPYRDWYYFKSPNSAGMGECAGDTTYESWFGFDSLPKLRANEEEARNLIWAGGPNAIARYWMQWADGWRLDVGGDVDPGLTNSPGNDYWEGFRDAVHETKPNAYIVGEEWGFATAWTLGQEWDATMNYQTSSAILSFWRDEPFRDNDHNSGSSAGELTPLTPSQLDERLHNIAERYPPEALQAMMNLLGSHDTSRPLFMLDHNTDQNNPALYQSPTYDWSDAMTRQRGVVLLQMTLPGAPTIYYGDEIGLVGPVAWDGTQWQDDPYNRQPYPWLDASGIPFYTHLRTQAGQDAMKNYYTLLTTARNAHPALRTGSFDTLLLDDTNDVYAYGRKLANNSDAAIVIANGSASARNVTLDLSGYLPVGAPLTNVLAGNASYTIPADGEIVLSVPAHGGALLVLTGGATQPPMTVTGLNVTDEQSRKVSLAWTAASDATSYDIYRSLVSGGGYSLIANTDVLTYTDTGLTNAQRYYYVVVSRNDSTGLTGNASNEVVAIPHHDLSSAWYNLQWPPEITHTISALTPTATIYGQLYIDGVTVEAGPADGIIAQVGYGPVGSAPSSAEWRWEAMTFNANVGNNDEYQGTLLPDMVGEYLYTTRYSSDGGATWYYTDRDGPPYSEDQAGRLHVVASSDTTAPAAPTSLALIGTTASSISFSWMASSATDLVQYEIYRKLAGESTYTRIATVEADMTSYTDSSVTTNETYDYYVVAVDSSFNRSAASNTIRAKAEPRMVNLTINVTVPSFTRGTVYIVGNNPAIGNWNPGAIPMTPTVGTPNQWTISLSVLDGSALEYKFTRGNWETVEKEADGNTEIPNRKLTAAFGTNGTQTNSALVRNWRDPIVVSHTPAEDATNVASTSAISVTWSQPMSLASDFTVNGPEGAISGTLSYITATATLLFTPLQPLRRGTVYSVIVADEMDAGGDVQQVPKQWTFRTGGSTLLLPIMAHRPTQISQQGSASATNKAIEPIQR